MRMLASDLDGTLIRPDGTMSARTLAALAACERAGVLVVFVTGRPPRWMAAVAATTGRRGVAICGNGAAVYDLTSGRIVDTRPLAAATVRRVVELLRRAFPDAVFALETPAGHRREPEFMGHVPAGDVDAPEDSAPPGPLEDVLVEGAAVLKVLCRVERRRADDLLVVAREVLHGIAEPVHSNANDCLLEISAPGVSKASALAALARSHGIAPAEVVAFGDMPNDVPMLRWAGRGYAVASGHPEAIAAADEVVPGIMEDGVAQIVERLLPLMPSAPG